MQKLPYNLITPDYSSNCIEPYTYTELLPSGPKGHLLFIKQQNDNKIQKTLKNHMELQDYQLRALELRCKCSEKLVELSEHTAEVTCVAFSQDGKLIASASKNKTIIIWNVQEKKKETTLIHGYHLVESIKFSNDSKYILCFGSENNVIVWELNNKTIHINYYCEDNPVSAGFSSNDIYIIVGLSNRKIIVWNFKKNKEVEKSFIPDSESISSVEFSGDGNYIVIGSLDGVIEIWDFSLMILKLKISAHEKKVLLARLSADGKSILRA